MHVMVWCSIRKKGFETLQLVGIQKRIEPQTLFYSIGPEIHTSVQSNDPGLTIPVWLCLSSGSHLCCLVMWLGRSFFLAWIAYFQEEGQLIQFCGWNLVHHCWYPWYPWPPKAADTFLCHQSPALVEDHLTGICNFSGHLTGMPLKYTKDIFINYHMIFRQWLWIPHLRLILAEGLQFYKVSKFGIL